VGYARCLAEEVHSEDTPLLEEWVAQVGEQGMVRAVRSTVVAIESGALPGFTDRDELLAYLSRPPAG